MKGEKRKMTEQKMKQINAWISRIDKNKLEMQDKMAIASATMEMLEKFLFFLYLTFSFPSFVYSIQNICLVCIMPV